MCARKLIVANGNTCLCRLQRRVCLRELDFVWARSMTKRRSTMWTICQNEKNSSSEYLQPVPHFNSARPQRIAGEIRAACSDRALASLLTVTSEVPLARCDRSSLSVDGKSPDMVNAGKKPLKPRLLRLPSAPPGRPDSGRPTASLFKVGVIADFDP